MTLLPTHATLTDAELDAAERICAAATPGPWEVGEDPEECAATLRAQPIVASTGEPSGVPVDVIIPFGRACSDATFIATSRTLVPALIAEVRSARRDLASAVAENLAFNLKAAQEINQARATRDEVLQRVGRLEDSVVLATVASVESMEMAANRLRTERDALVDVINAFQSFLAGEMSKTDPAACLEALRYVVSAWKDGQS